MGNKIPYLRKWNDQKMHFSLDSKEGVLSRMKHPCNIFSNNKKRFIRELKKTKIFV